MKRRFILPALLLTTCALLFAHPAAAQSAPEAQSAQADFAGKFLCVEDADNSWPLSHVHLAKVGGKEFIAGDMVPPPPEDDLKLKDDGDAKKPELKPAAKPKPAIKHREVMIPVDKVTDIQIFDNEEDLNTYYDSLDDDKKEPDSDHPTVY